MISKKNGLKIKLKDKTAYLDDQSAYSENLDDQKASLNDLSACSENLNDQSINQ